MIQVWCRGAGQTLADDAGQALQDAHVSSDGNVHLLHAEIGVSGAVADVCSRDDVQTCAKAGTCRPHSLASGLQGIP